VIDVDIRPFLQADGGDIELVSITGHCVKVRMIGACETCPSSESTLREGVEARIKARIGAVYTVEDVKG
jgi:Fe-S cluster biogenesis protein NfuA